MFTPLIKEQQTGPGSRTGYERYERYAGPSDRLSPMRNVGSSSNVIPSTWHPQRRTDGPYIQHRGGLGGFLYVFDDTTFGFVDLRGNTQFISVGNFLNDDRASTTCAGDDFREFAILGELIRGALMSLLHSFSTASSGNLNI